MSDTPRSAILLAEALGTLAFEELAATRKGKDTGDSFDKAADLISNAIEVILTEHNKS